MNNMLRKAIALLLCLCVCLTLVPAVYAEDDGIVAVEPLTGADEPAGDAGILDLTEEPEDIELVPDETEAPDEPAEDEIPQTPDEPDVPFEPDEPTGEAEEEEPAEAEEDVFAVGNIPVNETNFPDAAFRSYVETLDEDGDGLSEEEIEAVEIIRVPEKGIRSLEGIAFFTALSRLYCDKNLLTAIDVSKNPTLKILSCSDNMLAALDVSQNPVLENLTCSNNRLAALDVSGNRALNSLVCIGNRLTALDVSRNPGLLFLNCDSNQITSLDVRSNPALANLSCYSNRLTELDLSRNTALTSLSCGNNRLTALDLSGNTALALLSCYANDLSALDLSRNAALTELNCSGNWLTALDLSGSLRLRKLNAAFNQLRTLAVGSNSALTECDCSYNQLGSLDVSGCDSLTKLNCVENGIDTLNISRCTYLLWLARTREPDFRTYPKSVLYTDGSTMSLAYDRSTTLITGDTSPASILFDANGGSGTMDPQTVIRGRPETLDPNAFTRAGFAFDGWNTSADGSGAAFRDGDTVNVNRDLTLYARWKESAAGIPIDGDNFPDEAFRVYVSGFDKDRSGSLTESELAEVKYINVDNRGIKSLKGIEFFTALTTLQCQKNDLSSLDVSGNTALRFLQCSGNWLTALDVSKNTALSSLYCGSNLLAALDVSGNANLTYLSCSENLLTALDVSGNAALTSLTCARNKLTGLDVSRNPALTSLNCDGNGLTALDVSGNPLLATLSCHNTGLTSLDVTKNTALSSLSCGANRLTSLDVTKNAAITSLSCGSNLLTSLDVRENPLLTYLNVALNSLTALDLSGSGALSSLDCQGNLLRRLDITDCEHLLWLVNNTEPVENRNTITYGSTSARSLRYDKGVELVTSKQPAYTFSMSLNLAEAIGVNFYVGGAQSYDGLTIAWTKKDGTAVSMPVTSGTRRGDGSYVIPLEVFAAREMTVPIPVTVTDADGAVLKQTTCSVRAYCDAVAANAQVGESLKDLCHAALVYGSAAQTRFSFRTDDLADPDYRTSLPASVPDNADTAAARSDPAGGITGYGVSLNLISQTEMNVYLVHEKGTKFSDYSFSVKKNGAKYTNITAVENGSYYVVTVKGISPKDLTTSYAVEAKNGSASFTVTLTPLAYSRISQNSATDSEIAKGVYLYGLAAKAYK